MSLTPAQMLDGDLLSNVDPAVQAANTAANRAARAFWSWSRTDAQQRKDTLRAMADALSSGHADLTELAASEVGAAPPVGRFQHSDRATHVVAGLRIGRSAG